MSGLDDSFHHVAIVGRFGRFPGSPDLDAFWRNLAAGVESISHFTERQMLEAGTPPEVLADPAFVRAKSVLEEADRFDAAFFGYSPFEAERMDPQHRIFLEAAWAALEDAGYDPARYGGRIGVFAGAAANTYLRSLYANPEALQGLSDIQVVVGHDKDFLATKVSYKLDLRGPSVVVQSACSTSLVAIHLACQSLISQESSLALAGGVSVKAPLVSGYRYQEGGHRSPDGSCRAFDADAAGTPFGDGVGVVVLKRLAEAVADGDTIHAVIRGTAVNNDGALKVGYTAPSESGQAEVVAEALAIAGVEPRSVGMIEAHGTGTALGDPIEVAALRRTYGADAEPGERGARTALGSVKTNLGHLDAAAGIAGLLKAVLALERGEVPPSLHFRRPNPTLELEDSPFFVPIETRPWPLPGPRRAGVSSFGVGGTNAHVVLEQAPSRAPSGSSREWQLLAFSARDDRALGEMATKLATHLEREADTPLADIAHTLRVGRRQLPRRRVAVGRDREELARRLAAGEGFTAGAEREDRPVDFLFPGQGTPYVGMGEGLYRSEPELRRWIDRGCEALERREPGLELRRILYPSPAERPEAERTMTTTAVAQPALFVVSHALARLWMSWGVRPRAMLGHSLGEWVAACLAGVVSFEDAVALVAARGALMQARPAGAMLAVPLSPERLEARLGGTLALAAVNAPERSVVSGPLGAVEDLETRLREEGVACRRLATSHAFHSAMMDPAVAAFVERLSTVTLRPPEIPFVSGVTGTWITPRQATDPEYWGRQMRGTVRFADGLATLTERDPLLLEVGPGRTLSSLARRAGGDAVASLGAASPGGEVGAEEEPEERRLLAALGALWAQGAPVDWSAFQGDEVRHRVPLPTYPFERRRFWIDARPGASTSDATRPSGGELRRRKPYEWLSVPIWRQLPPLAHRVSPTRATGPAGEGDPPSAARWLLVSDRSGWADALAGALSERGVLMTLAEEPGDPDESRVLLGSERFARVVDLRGADPVAPAGPASPAGDDPSRAFRDLLALGLAAADAGGAEEPVEMAVVTSGIADIAGEGDLEPAKALLAGPVAVLPQEEPSLRCRGIDVTAFDRLRSPRAAAERLADELIAGADAPRWVALRGARRFGRELAAWSPPESAAPSRGQGRLREGGVYWITGGLGGLGLALARHLAETRGARLVLTGRSAAPEESAAVRELERSGARVLARSADVTDADAMARVLAEVDDTFGALHGVFHAAGVPGGGMARRRSREEIEAVFAPKVRGAAVLDALLAGRELDFVLFFSSLNAEIGGVGQVDYAAANAFLDALAERRAAEGGTWSSVDWDAWLEVGMAAGGSAALPVDPDRHPLLQRVERSVDGVEARALLRRGHAWMADEHRILGHAVVPGTALLEVARELFASLADETGPALVIRDAVFMVPLVAGDAPREVVSRLERPAESGEPGERGAAEGWRYEVASRPATGDGAALRVHAVARVDALDEGPRPFDLEAARARCRQIPPDERLRSWWLGYDGSRDDEEIARYGPRWRNLTAFFDGGDECVAELELAPEARGDLELHGFHPGLMDVAVGSLYRVRDRGRYAPFRYGELRLHGPVPARVAVYTRRRDPDADYGTGDPELLLYDVVVCDPDGEVLVEVEEYTYKRVRSEAPVRSDAGAAAPASVGRGIAPPEGLRVLERILDAGPPARVVVSTLDPRALERQFKATVARLREPAPPTRGLAYPRPDLATPYVAPRDAEEARVAEIFQQVLGVDRVGVDDSFFELGGDSVIALQIIARAGQAGLRLSPTDLFQHPTVAELAARGAAAGEEDTVAGLPPIEPTEGRELPLSLNQERYWARYLLQGPSAAFNLPLAVGLHGRLDLLLLASGLQRIVDRHASLRTRFRRATGGADAPVQVIADRLRVRMPVVDLSGLAAVDEEASVREARRLRDLEASHVFDLEGEDLFRITLVRRTATEHQLFVVKHHLVTDGWSGGLFAQELATLYTAMAEGREVRLPELTVRYADFALWQRRHMGAGGLLEKELEHWRRELDGGDFPRLKIEGDHPAGTAGSASRDAARVLGEAPYRALQDFARRENVTPFMVLLAVFNVLLAARTGQRDLSLTTDVANRDRVETEGLIGLFTNVLILRNDLSGDPDVATLLARTRESSVRAFDHQALPFSHLMEELAPGRLEAYHEVFPVAFIFQNYPGRSFSLPGVELRSLEIDSGSVSRDLLVVIGEAGEGLRVSFRYRTDLFEPATVERWLEDYMELLERLPEDRGRRLSELLEGLSAERAPAGGESVPTWGGPG